MKEFLVATVKLSDNCNKIKSTVFPSEMWRRIKMHTVEILK